MNKFETITKINSGLSLIQNPEGLTFGTDAYLLASYVRRSPGAKAADLGSGTGIIPLLILARDKVRSVDAYELQPDFAELITRNAELNHLESRLTSICADVRELKPDGSFDVVTANPPYMPGSGKMNVHDCKSIARHELSGGIGDFCAAAYRLLRHGGLFYVVFRPDRICDLICALRDARLEPKRITLVYARRELPPCLILCEAKKGASPGAYTTPPLIMYESGSTGYTPELAAIYDRGDFDERYVRP